MGTIPHHSGAATKKAPGAGRGRLSSLKEGKRSGREADQPNLPEVEAIRKAA